jgi:hypothetical protein
MRSGLTKIFITTASYECIEMRLGGMKEILKGDLSQEAAASLVKRIEAELPSPMAVYTTCQELEDNQEKFPSQAKILLVLKDQKRIWKARMAAVDIARIEQLGIDWGTARSLQHAIFGKALRERLESAGHNDLLALLDVDADKRMEDCAHYVSAIADLRREKCDELAEKLRRGVEVFQGDNDGDWKAYCELGQLYDEARHVIQEKRYERECAERARQERQRRYEKVKREVEDAYWKEIALRSAGADPLKITGSRLQSRAIAPIRRR